MSKYVKDLVGLGEIIRQVKEFALTVLRLRLTRDERRLKREAQQLKNEEQALKNQERKIRNVTKLLVLAKKYRCRPDEVLTLPELHESQTHWGSQQVLTMIAVSKDDGLGSAQKVLSLPKK